MVQVKLANVTLLLIDFPQELLERKRVPDLQLVVDVATAYREKLGINNIVELLEGGKSSEGLFLFLHSYVPSSTDPALHMKYIEAAAKAGRHAELESFTRSSAKYPSEQAKLFLMDANLPDTRFVCPSHLSILTCQDVGSSLCFVGFQYFPAPLGQHLDL